LNCFIWDFKILVSLVLDALNGALSNNMKEEFLQTLKSNVELLQSDIDSEYGGSLYFVEFKYILEEKQANLDIDDFIHGIKVLNVIVNINKIIENCTNNLENNYNKYCKQIDECLVSDSTRLYEIFKNPNVHLQDVGNESLKVRYLNSLISCKQSKTNNNFDTKTTCSSLSDSGHDECDFLSCNLLTHGEIQECISQTNADYEQECLAVVLLNDSLTKDNVAHTFYLLKNSLPKDDKVVIIDQNAFIYHTELKKLKEVLH
jgi:hypothetical protein